MPNLTINFSDQDYATLTALTKSLTTTKADILRRALRRFAGQSDLSHFRVLKEPIVEPTVESTTPTKLKGQSP